MNAARATTQSLRLVAPERTACTDILLGRALLGQAQDVLAPFRKARLAIISDERVAPLHAAPLRDLLEESGYSAHLLRIPSGEDAKSIETLIHLYKECKRLELDRDDVVVAVGGGMVGDVAGMVASTYLRGLEFVQIPTSLVAMVSASVGGKVGVNFLDYKNLIGAFKQPAMVIADPLTLDTLPAIEFRSGLGELVTVGVLGDAQIFESLESRGALDIDPLIMAAIKCKKEIVEADPLDRSGIRARLNLGHTFGHALEKLSDFNLPHGLAVGVGLHIASRLAAEMKLCPPSVPERIRRTLLSLDLPVTLEGYFPEEMIHAMRGDKKRAGGLLRFVLPVSIGEVILFSEDDVPRGLLEDLLRIIVTEGQG